jgi:hypothetical protein
VSGILQSESKNRENSSLKAYFLRFCAEPKTHSVLFGNGEGSYPLHPRLTNLDVEEGVKKVTTIIAENGTPQARVL